MRKEWPWIVFSALVFYCAALFACMIKMPHYTGLPRWSTANFLDAQPFSLGVTACLLAWLVVEMRREK